MSIQPQPAPTASAIGSCPTIIPIVGHPALEIYPGPSQHPTTPIQNYYIYTMDVMVSNLCEETWIYSLNVFYALEGTF